MICSVMGRNSKAKTIDEYLTGVKPDQRSALQKLRRAIRAAAPSAQECISYGMPAFRVDGRALVYFAAWANHCALYPGSSTTLRKFRDELKGFEISKGTVRFSHDKPLPISVVRKLIKARVAETKNRGSTKRKES